MLGIDIYCEGEGQIYYSENCVCVCAWAFVAVFVGLGTSSISKTWARNITVCDAEREKGEE